MQKVLHDIIALKHKRHAKAIVLRLRRWSVGDVRPDFPSAKSVWDLWKLELQEDHSTIHGPVEEMVSQAVSHYVDSLPIDEVALLTLGLDDVDDESLAEPKADTWGVAKSLLSAVNDGACDEPPRRSIQRLLDADGLDRFKRDNEPHQA